MVLLFSGLSFAGYVALRWAGPRRGLGLAGLLGGVVSSTAVTINFARESRAHPDASTALAGGVLAAAAVLPVRVGVLSAVLHLEVARALVPVLALPVLLGAVAVASQPGSPLPTARSARRCCRRTPCASSPRSR